MYYFNQLKEWWLNISSNNPRLMVAILTAIVFLLFGATTYIHYTLNEAYGPSVFRDVVAVIVIVYLPVLALAYWTFRNKKQ